MEETYLIDNDSENKKMDFFGKITRTFYDMYEGKGSLGELAKSRETQINKIKEDIFCVLYGDKYKEKKTKRNVAKSNI